MTRQTPVRALKFAAIALAAAAFECALHYALAYGASQNGRMLFGFALILAARKNRRSAKFVFILALAAIAFCIVGMEYGRLMPDFIGALMETNAEETKEFLSLINPVDIAFACLLCAALAFALFAWQSGEGLLPPPPPSPQALWPLGKSLFARLAFGRRSAFYGSALIRRGYTATRFLAILNIAPISKPRKRSPRALRGI
ncbi:MAG: phosphoethanolamine transferase domain-containing protein [Helicobacteraceae bacterium]|nr:phosphoethanolamine transferase domain-containing protein [Helicobacteraceae bacterium]